MVHMYSIMPLCGNNAEPKSHQKVSHQIGPRLQCAAPRSTLSRVHSHSTKDRWIAKQIAKLLEESGDVKTFLDERDIRLATHS